MKYEYRYFFWMFNGTEHPTENLNKLIHDEGWEPVRESMPSSPAGSSSTSMNGRILLILLRREKITDESPVFDELRMPPRKINV